jgi:hypothetical protein
MKLPNHRWKIEDVLDFEQLLQSDSAGAGDGGQERAEVQAQLAVSGIDPDDKRAVFRQWLEIRRSQQSGELPGAAFRVSWQTLQLLAVLCGLLAGMAVAGALTNSHGSAPLNLLEFLGIVLLPQWLFLVGALLLWLDHHTFRFLIGFRPLRAGCDAVIRICSGWLRKLPGEKRAALDGIWARISGGRENYGNLVVWPSIIALQLFAVCFNLGVLGFLGFHGISDHLAFTWQSYWIGHETLSAWVSQVPWPHPTPEKIAATEFREGVAFDLDAMQAWAPFVGFTVFALGLLPRLLLLIIAGAQLRRNLAALRLDQADANRLWRRLRGLRIASAGGETAPGMADGESRRSGEHSPGQCLVLAARECVPDEAAVREYLFGKFGWELREIVAVRLDHFPANTGLAATLQSTGASLAGIVVLVAADSAPIVGHALFLKEVQAMADGKEVILLLRGTANELVSQSRYWKNLLQKQQLAAKVGLETWTI